MKTADPDPDPESGSRGAINGSAAATSTAWANSAQHSRSYGTAVTRPARSSEQDQSKQRSEIPPPDTGRAAWLFLIGCFWLEGLVWAFPLSFGVFEHYYSHHHPFAGQAGVPTIGTTELGIAYFLAPPVMLALQRWPRHRRKVSVLGLLLIIASLVGASFATRVEHLVWTQGLLYGVGGSLLYNPFMFYLDEWFVKRKGLAYGVAWAGTSFCGSIIPLLMEWGLQKYGFQLTLRAWALLIFIILSFLVYTLGPRIPPSDERVAHSVDLTFLGTKLFWTFQAANVVQGLGYFIPTIYLPSFAKSVGFSSMTATLSVSFLNSASSVGMIFIGALADRIPLSWTFVMSAIGSAASVFLLWGFAVVEVVLYLFAICYGVFAGGFVATWARCATEIQTENPTSDVAVIMGLMAAGRGLGSMISGPVSENLRNMDRWNETLQGAYGTSFGGLIIFAGISALLSGIGYFGKPRRPSTPPRDHAAERDPLMR